MNMEEYLNARTMTYLQYCECLQTKYGIGTADFFSKNFRKNQKVTRTKDGLYAHHKMEDRVADLGKPEIAMLCPYEWQTKENIVYCDLLEHLLLHVLICKYPRQIEKIGDVKLGLVGYGGVVIIAGELNDLYSGWKTAQEWRMNCHRKVENSKKVYLAILQQFLENEKQNIEVNSTLLHCSFNAPFGLWSHDRNKKIYAEIDGLLSS